MSRTPAVGAGGGAAEATRRVYLPLGAAGLATLAEDGAVLPPGGIGYAVTAVVRQAFAGDDEEELEYAALCAAAASPVARDSLDGRGSLQVVMAADVPAGQLTEAHPDGADPVSASASAESAGVNAGCAAYQVRLRAAVPLRQVASVHVEEAGAGDDGELLWYDVSELPQLAAALS